MKILIAFVVLLISISSAADAQLRRLTAPEMVQLLTGNTVFFNANGVTQKQFFEVGGKTVFEDERQTIHEEGQWRVTRDHLFCSNWKKQGWVCYQLALEGSRLVWTGPITGHSGIATSADSKLVAGNKTNTYRERPNQRTPASMLPSLARMLMDESIPGSF